MSVFNYPSFYEYNFKFGVTMLGDPGFDFAWTQNLHAVVGAAISSKTANPKFEDLLIANKKKIIYRPVISGLGGTKIEPGIPSPEKVLAQINNLIMRGFPRKQIVPQISPLMPMAWLDALQDTTNRNYIDTIKYLLVSFRSFGLTRVYHSFMSIDSISAAALRKIDQRLSLNFNEFFFNSLKELALNVIDDSFQYETSDPRYYPYAKTNYTVSNDDLIALGVYDKYRFQRPMDQFTNLLQLINRPIGNCRGMCVLCPYGNKRRFDIFDEHQ